MVLLILTVKNIGKGKIFLSWYILFTGGYNFITFGQQSLFILRLSSWRTKLPPLKNEYIFSVLVSAVYEDSKQCCSMFHVPWKDCVEKCLTWTLARLSASWCSLARVTSLTWSWLRNSHRPGSPSSWSAGRDQTNDWHPWTQAFIDKNPQTHVNTMFCFCSRHKVAIIKFTTLLCLKGRW